MKGQATPGPRVEEQQLPDMLNPRNSFLKDAWKAPPLKAYKP